VPYLNSIFNVQIYSIYHILHWQKGLGLLVDPFMEIIKISYRDRVRYVDLFYLVQDKRQ
jgi:hypothetical protein